MKTTIDLPDALLIEAKKHAAETRTTLRQLVARGLRRELAAGPEPAEDADEEIRWVVVEGGLPPGVDPADRVKLHDWIRKAR